MKPAHRAAVFWLVCIPTRTALALTAKTVQPNSEGQRLLRLGATCISAMWVTGQVMNVEGAFGGRAWWANQRRLHGVMFGGYALTGDWRWLASDAALGACNWLIHNFPSSMRWQQQLAC